MFHSVIDTLDNGRIQKTSICCDPYSMEYMTATINHFINNPNPLVVPTYNFKKLKKLMYTYEMDKLDCITKEEEQLIDLVGDFEFEFNPLKAIKHLDYRHPSARHMFPSLVGFLEQVLMQGRYHDLHGGNIMIDSHGDYKLIDLESFNNPPLSKEENNWVTV